MSASPVRAFGDGDGRLGPRSEWTILRDPDDGRWLRAGAYDRSSGSFDIERFPCPPEAVRATRVRVPLAPQVRRSIERGPAARQAHIEHRLAVACPGCDASVDLWWREPVDDFHVERLESAISSAQSEAYRAKVDADAVRRQLADAHRTVKRERSRAVKAQAGNAKKRRGW